MVPALERAARVVLTVADVSFGDAFDVAAALATAGYLKDPENDRSALEERAGV